MLPSQLCDDLAVEEHFVIDLWSDVVCPFCYLGTRQLAESLEQFEHRDVVTIRHRAFELDARTKLSHDRPLAELVAAKYAMPVSQVHAMHERLERSAEALGMTWSLEGARPTNTFDAHRVIALATARGVGGAASERLFRAYFCEGELVSDHARLSALAAEVGVTGAEDLWGSDAFSEEVRADEIDARELGVTGVPFFLFDSKFMVAGAQGPEQILDVLQSRLVPTSGLSLVFARYESRRRHGMTLVEVHHAHAGRVATLRGDLANRCANEHATG